MTDWQPSHLDELLMSPDVLPSPIAAKELRELMPEDAFRAKPQKVLWMILHVLVVYGCYAGSAHFSSWWQITLLGICSGHSFACMGFMAHELSHGIIVKEKTLRTWLECFFWGLVFVSPTMWRRTHNASHHLHYGTAQDPDRMFMEHERTISKTWYVKWFYPNAELFPWNPLVLLYQVPYFIRNTVSAFLPRGQKLGMVPAAPRYRDGDSWKVLGEMIVILLLQVTLFATCHFQWEVFLPMLLISQLCTSALVMTYVFTNHFLQPLHETPDPLSGSSSVIVPVWVDLLHSHFSYHTEHHVFPNLRSEYYPLLSRILRERYPDRYHRVPLGKAWKQLWRNPAFLTDIKSPTSPFSGNL